ncbi:acyl-CoA dehydrogenase family protein [Corynebacterium aquatimens]|uniref:acyl-CoA oxidase n=1 Tax=Corynebacterium aquatimens TaxID=1190508 RepID=A0A931GXN1_9CORY|nr:acyl-CoA dehydrogenase [Corynebacterium aquatimens]MBG6122009.1 acyl-CoA oxidase [Corynebacterium aquatimens]WJY65452.1 Acyl-CoA dehydrogenase, short-chain specific [Corynebacterium aquatimens]
MTSAEAKEGRKAKPESRSPQALPETPDAAIAGKLKKVLDGPFEETKDEIRANLNREEALPQVEGTLEEIRAGLLEKVKMIGETGMMQTAFSKRNGGSGEAHLGINGLDLLAQVNDSLAIKSGVQWGLWGGAVDVLGTDRHKEYAQGAMNLTKLGSYGMTERGHGSNVQALQTTATYDPETKEFVINTPSPMATKTYIGNTARDGRWSAVFAQLYTPGVEESHGVHCFVVRIREEDGTPCEGVTIGDHGHKGGLLGVDNGTLTFDNVRIPREALLNQFADVDEEGNYTSPIESSNRRFFTMLGTLIRGRLAVGAAGAGATKSSLAIALKYAHQRRQFNTGDENKEAKLIEHRVHRRRLIIPLARTYAIQLLQNKLVQRYADQTSAQASGEWSVTDPTPKQADAAREMESLAAAFKAVATEHAMDAIQEARESCGGAGFMSENMLTTFRADTDVFVTFEGDNMVLLQLAGKNLITAFAKELENPSPMDLVKFAATNVTDIVRSRVGLGTAGQSVVDTFTSEEASLFDAEYQLKVLALREQLVLRSLVRRIQSARKLDRAEAAKVVDGAQDHLVNAAWAWIESLMAQAFIEAEQELPEGSTERAVIEQVRNLFVLDTIIRNAGWYQEQNVLSSGRVKAARAAINDLVDSLGPWSEVLVDAFAIPEVVLDRPMFKDGGTDDSQGKEAWNVGSNISITKRYGEDKGDPAEHADA